MWILVLLGGVAGGAAATYFYEDDAPLPARLWAGIPSGLALFGLVGFGLSCVLGLTTSTVGLAAAAASVPLAAVLLRPVLRARLLADVRRAAGHRRVLRHVVLFTIAALCVLGVFGRVCYDDPAGGISTGSDHNVGDLPFHVAVITSFAKAENLPPEHPELAGVRLTYPFLVDFVAAMLLRTGADLTQALLAENVLLGLALLGLLHRWALRATRNTRAAALAVPLALLTGGLGFVLLFAEARHADGGLLGLLHRLPHDYTITWSGELRWGNLVTTLLVPQRAFLLGLPLALAIVTCWWRAVAEPSPQPARSRLMLGAGVLAGLLPLAHAHSFTVLVIAAVGLAFLFPDRRAWAAFFATALAVAVPQALWLAAGSAVRAGAFVEWAFGWDRGGRNPIWFWFTNTGLFLPLLAVALARGRSSRLVRFTAPFLVWLLVPNLLKLSPWIWDNVKFLIYGYVASVPLVALLLARMARRGWGGGVGATLLVASLTLSGGLDVWRLARGHAAHRLFDVEGRAFSARALEATPPRSLILHAPTYDSPVYLSGRRSLLGYPGHIWSQGLDAGGREEDLGRIYSGGAEAERLLDRYGVDFVLFGPHERARFAVDEGFLSRFPLAAAAGSYRLYDTRPR
ncbi:MAG: hypothetical protein HY317_02490 [Acidobacteria bacterium]|nr:hypothetical protein [Acidobacteriota bacterium]